MLLLPLPLLFWGLRWLRGGSRRDPRQRGKGLGVVCRRRSIRRHSSRGKSATLFSANRSEYSEIGCVVTRGDRRYPKTEIGRECWSRFLTGRGVRLESPMESKIESAYLLGCNRRTSLRHARPYARSLESCFCFSSRRLTFQSLVSLSSCPQASI